MRIARLAFLLILLSQFGCGMIVNGIKEAANESTAGSTTKTLLTKDKKLEITVPGTWVEDNTLNDEADLGAQHKVKEQYIILLDEKKSDFDEDMTLQKHSDLTLGSMKENLKNPEVDPAKELQINGNPAIQHIVKGSTDGINIVFIHTTVATKDSYCQVLAWTLNSQWGENEKPLMDVVNSLKEAGSAKAPASPKP